jgi:hypothetical protein
MTDGHCFNSYSIVKEIITTRISLCDLAISEPGRQHQLSLDEGLESPYAENVLRDMEADRRVGLKSAPDEDEMVMFVNCPIANQIV